MAEAFLTENLPEAVFGAPKVNIVVLVSWYILLISFDLIFISPLLTVFAQVPLFPPGWGGGFKI